MTRPSITTAARLGEVREYYFSRKLREIRDRRAAGEDILNLGIGSPDLPPPAAAIENLGTDVSAAGAHGYQGYGGIPEWRGALRRWYGDAFAVELADDEVLPLAGSKEGIVHLALALLEPGRTMLHPDPGYPAYPAAARLAQADNLGYRMPARGESAADWCEAIAQSCGTADVRVVFVNSPHMPTGQVLDRDHLAALAAFAKTRGAVLVSDNAYGYYHPAGPRSVLEVPEAREVGVELNSLSKSHHMPGWRLGALVGRADVVAAALQVKSNLDSGQFRPVQAGAAAALATPWSWHELQLEQIAARRAVGEELLGCLGCAIPPHQHGLFVWARLPAGHSDAEAFCDVVLDEAAVFFPPGTVFGVRGEGHVRLSLCSPRSVLEEGLRRVRTTSIAVQTVTA